MPKPEHAMSDPTLSEDSPRRPIHYLGSKLRFASDIADVIDDVASDRGSICDLFSGSGVVSSALAVRRPVVAVDIQEYARVLSSALLNPMRLAFDSVDALTADVGVDAAETAIRDAWIPLVEYEHAAIEEGRRGNPEPLAELLESLPLLAFQRGERNHLPSRLSKPFSEVARSLSRPVLSSHTVISRYYGGLYFGIEQAACLDVLARRCRNSTAIEQDVVMAALLSTASAVVCTVGKQFAQPLRPRDRRGAAKEGLWKRVDSDRARDVLIEFRNQLGATTSRAGGMPGSRAVRADFRHYLRNPEDELAAIYADPPYTRDHYSRYYHVLETIALGDEPEVTRTNLNGGCALSRGVYRAGRHQSPFSIIRQAPTAFDDLFRLTQRLQVPLVLSYSPHLADGASRPRVMSIEAILEIASCYFASAQRLDVEGISHSKLNRTGLHLSAPETAEVLLLLRP